jgi:threonine dehydrogenase-like Zn-dependent dehydrogenase
MKAVVWHGIGVIDPVTVLTKVQPLTGAIEAYEHFGKREAGWIKTELKLAQAAE